MDDYTLRTTFWLLKKYSSYTWAAEIHQLFTKFVNDLEAWMRTNPPDATDFEEDVLRRVWYMQSKSEEGLNLLKNSGEKSRAYALLRQGFKFGSLFWADRLFTDNHSEAFDRLGFVGFFYKMYHEGETPPCSGIFSSLGAAETMRQNFFGGQGGCCSYERVVNSQKYLSFIREYKTPLWAPRTFPPLPTPDTVIEILSGEQIPVSGIWLPEPIAEDPIPAEMLVVTGGRQTYCINFMVQGTVAPKMVSEEEHLLVMEQDYRPIPKDRAVRWRLLWKDERYGKNGIPEEEKDYLRVEEETAPQPEEQADVRVIRCEGGNLCPRSGYWHVWHEPGTRRYFNKGELMPGGLTAQGERIWYWDEQQDK